MNHTYIRPGRVTISDGDAAFGMLMAVGAAVAAVAAAAWFLITYALVLAIGAGIGSGITAGFICWLWRRHTVLVVNHDAYAACQARVIAERNRTSPDTIAAAVQAGVEAGIRSAVAAARAEMAARVESREALR